MQRFMSHNPVTCYSWRLQGRQELAVASDFVNKWKPKILHLEPLRSEQMSAVNKLVDEQLKNGREFVVSSAVGAEMWRAEAGKLLLKREGVMQMTISSSHANGPRLRAATSDRVLEDRARHYRNLGGAKFPRDLVRRVVKEVADMKTKAKRDKVEVYSMDIRGGGLHEEDHRGATSSTTSTGRRSRRRR